MAFGRGFRRAQFRVFARMGTDRQGPRGWPRRRRSAVSIGGIPGLPVTDGGCGARDLSLFAALRLRDLAARAWRAHEQRDRAGRSISVRDAVVREHERIGGWDGPAAEGTWRAGGGGEQGVG